jgi:hypothetical protein
MSAEPTIQEQLRTPICRTAYLCEQAAARLDDLERQLEKVQYWRDRHCRESEQHAQRSGENWKAWKAAERQLATVVQAERERCAKECDKEVDCWTFEDARQAAGDCATRIRALAPHAAKEPQAANSPIPTERTPLDAAIKIAELERECERLRVVADASKSFVNSEGSESVVRGLALVDAVRALERDEVKS